MLVFFILAFSLWVVIQMVDGISTHYITLFLLIYSALINAAELAGEISLRFKIIFILNFLTFKLCFIQILIILCQVAHLDSIRALIHSVGRLVKSCDYNNESYSYQNGKFNS